MAFDVRILSKARQEFKDSVQWYNKQLNGLGDRFSDAVFNKLDAITNNPFQYPLKRSNFRECKTNDFPFLIVFKVDDQNQIILIYSVFHTNRRPGKNTKDKTAKI